MPRKRKQDEARLHKIYVLISLTTKDFYVGKTPSPVRSAYKNHVFYKNKTTASIFLEAEKTHIFPNMYLLDEINATPKEAFGHVVAWTKYFVENGLTPVTYKTVLTYTEELTETNEAIYARIKELPLETVLCAERLVVSDYKKREKEKPSAKKDNGRFISLHLSPDNYELVSYKAKEAGMSVSAYCRKAALEGYVVTIGVWDQIDELVDYKSTLRIILEAILQKGGKYYPADISNIEKLTKKVNQTQIAVAKYLGEQIEALTGTKKLKAEQRKLKKEIKELEKQISLREEKQ